MSNDQNKHSSSSSEYSSLIFNISNTCYVTETTQTDEIQNLTKFQGQQFPKINGEDDAITRAYLAVLSSSPSSSLSRGQIQENLTRDHRLATRKATAFRKFRSTLGPNASIGARTCTHNMLKRSMTFFKNLYLMNWQEKVQVNRLTNTQVHHIISERRRREKLNENFQQLRALLPPGTKDKVSILASTTEYLSSLKDQVKEQCKRNEILEAQLLTESEASQFHQHGSGRVAVYIRYIEARIVDLQVIVRGKCSILDLVIHLLEFLKMVNIVSLVSVEANTMMVQSFPVALITLRLSIQGDEWDESAFLEAAKRVVGDMT
ncbi:hypothetical protein RND71_036464 [Anisodus tanguticus]|uniref:BHLH domain-containing protein n=1 Tax=Anisodus tanguticus TaxID=243964 RepID=A0AAE1R108_9SOLA|nr:hypothetical protein RND71_036464 [Anisodus tanguticus]